MIVNERFPVSSTVAKLLWGVGILMGILGLLALGAELLEYLKMSKPGAEWVWSSNDFIRIVGGGLFIISGVLVMALAEIIGVLFAIEKNTRR
jgi:hypothetical protein